MSGLLLDVGRKLGERWVAVLVLPGLLYVGTVVIAYVLGWRHAADVSMLTTMITHWSHNAAARSAGGIGLLIAAVLLSSSGAALAAEALGMVLARCWLAERWPCWPAPVREFSEWLVKARVSRWEKAIAGYRAGLHEIGYNQALAAAGLAAEQPYYLAALYRRVERVARECPVYPTWVGDRIRAVTVSLRRRYDLNLAVVWPALSLAIPADARAAIDGAANAYRRSASLAAWAVLYAAVGVAWWPALAIACATAATAAFRSRVAVEDYSLLVEAAVVLHTPDLMRSLGIAHAGALDREAGAAITCYLAGGSIPDA